MVEEERDARNRTRTPAHLGEFRGYFMVRKVIAGQELLKASGTVTRQARALAIRAWIHRRSVG
jgi:hypothetical protein